MNLLRWQLRYINDDHIQGVDVDLLEAHHQLFVLVVKIPHDRDTGISNIQLIFYFDEKCVFVRVLLVKSDQVKAKLWLEQVGKDVESLVIYIVDYLLYVANWEFFVQVDKLSWVNIDKKAFLLTCYYQGCLCVIWQEELGALFEFIFKWA